MRLAGELRDDGGDLGEGGVEVSTGDRRRCMASEGLGDGVAGETAHVGDRRVAEYVG